MKNRTYQKQQMMKVGNSMKFNDNSIYIALEKRNPDRYVLLVQIPKKEETCCWVMTNWIMMNPTEESELKYKQINEFDWAEFPKELFFNDKKQICHNILFKRPVVLSIQDARNQNLFYDYEPSIYNLSAQFDPKIPFLFEMPNQIVYEKMKKEKIL